MRCTSEYPLPPVFTEIMLTARCLMVSASSEAGTPAGRSSAIASVSLFLTSFVVNYRPTAHALSVIIMPCPSCFVFIHVLRNILAAASRGALVVQLLKQFHIRSFGRTAGRQAVPRFRYDPTVISIGAIGLRSFSALRARHAEKKTSLAVGRKMET